MSDVGRYRKVYVRLWRHPDFVGLTSDEKIIALYLLSGPQSNRCGIYVLSIAQAAEDLGNLPPTFEKRFRNVCQTFGWLFDSKARVLYIPSWWRWNPPENVNVLKGNLRDLSELPPCGLVDAFSRNIEAIDETLRETFVEGLRQRLPKRSSTQKQEQDQNQNLDQKPPRSARAGERKNGPSPTNGAAHELPAHLAAAARQTLKLHNPNRPLEELVDAFKITLRQSGGGDCSTPDAQQAINVALAERRVS